MLFALDGLTLIISHATPVAMPGAEVTSTTVNVTHVVNGQKIVLPEQVNESARSRGSSAPARTRS